MSEPSDGPDTGSVVIRLNGERREVGGDSTLLGLLSELRRDPRTVAIECNGEIVPRSRFGEVRVAEGDRIELVQFVQGG